MDDSLFGPRIDTITITGDPNYIATVRVEAVVNVVFKRTQGIDKMCIVLKKEDEIIRIWLDVIPEYKHVIANLSRLKRVGYLSDEQVAIYLKVVRDIFHELAEEETRHLEAEIKRELQGMKEVKTDDFNILMREIEGLKELA